ncbi:MAG: NTP transferase domain-containing protein [Armatimonadota bacterium]|nr:NTP transferase domain-containing protein [bacterium]MCS7309450.1 NTP transferase domain-containing protein [Armatimonadota bacterium]MDW8103785.1 NTP transferase domain-containing protein [Armatimonadota bacterium]MDW8289259.1 NTP transferase domain-containing protein [Armatimonadota bacterium]
MTQAIILAAGAGTRFWPYNEVRNKCTTPVVNEPAVRRLAKQLCEAGIRRLVVVVGVHAGSVRAALHRLEGLEIAFTAVQGTPGTAHCVLAALTLLDTTQPFLVAYGDIVTTQGTVNRFLEVARGSEAAAVALVQPIVPPERPIDWLGASVRSGRLEYVEGHSRDCAHRLCGMYAFSPAALPAIHDNPGVMTQVPVGGMPPLEAELAQSVQTLLDDGTDVLAVEVEDYLVDMDKPWHILEANRRALDEMSRHLTENRIHPTARVHDGAEIKGFAVIAEGGEIGNRVVIEGNVFIGRHTRVVNGAIVGHSVAIGNHTRISDYCLIGAYSVVGHRCIVGHGAELDGVMFDGAYLYHYCEIAGVVGQSVDIGAATVCGTLRFDDAETIHRIKGRREFPVHGADATYFGDFSRTGVNVITQPGVKIGAYTCIGPGVVVYEDVPSRKLLLLKQELIEKDWGPERYGW